jgi:hypothetical protein
MRSSRIVVAVASLFLVSALAACGGGGHGFQVASDPLVITSTQLPNLSSGQPVDFEIPLSGGCGGPYVMAVIQGALPNGLQIDTSTPAPGVFRHHLVGHLLTSDNFAFTIQVTDTACNPFLTTTAAFVWNVPIGAVTIVDSNPPSLTPAAAQALDPLAWPDINAFPTTVYNALAAITLVIAGGVPPYTCTLVDVDDNVDPNDDTSLPQGTVLSPAPANHGTIAGHPAEVKPGGVPFRLSIQVMDSVGNVGMRQFGWKIDTPAIRIVTNDLPDGKCGKPYGDVVQVADGVPPFKFELCDDAATSFVVDGVVEYDVDYGFTPPVVNSTVLGGGFTLGLTGASSNKLEHGSAAVYPGPAVPGPYEPFPPEGVYLIDTGGGAGTVGGAPRRSGNFTIYVHVHSSLVPNEKGQHAWKVFNFDIAPSEPPIGVDPAFGINYGFTVEAQNIADPPSSTLPEFSYGNPYNPDGGAAGLQLIAEGGVPMDGVTDHAHFSDVAPNPMEMGGSYRWVVTGGDWDLDQIGVQPKPNGIDLLPVGFAPYSAGVLGIDAPNGFDEFDLVRQGRKRVHFTVTDDQLPTPLQNSIGDAFGYSVGPDKVVVAASTNSCVQTLTTSVSQMDCHDCRVRVRRWENLNGSSQFLNLTNLDMPLTQQTLPADCTGITDLAELLSGDTSGGVGAGDAWVDLLRVAVNPTGYWDDIHGMNVNGPRPFKHSSEAQASYNYYGMGYPNSYAGMQPDASSVDVQNCRDGSIAHSPATGVYTNGGQLYAFESLTRFGVFILRRDGTVYVPFAYTKTATYTGFGDGMVQAITSSGNLNSAMRIAHITISPDGRFAAMKLMKNPGGFASNLREVYTDSGIVLMDLCATEFFGGANYKIIGTSTVALSLPTGVLSAVGPMMHATSMALTNRALYFIMGTWGASTNASYNLSASWRDHYVMRYEVKTAGGAEGGAAAASLATSPNATWNQSSTTPMQTPFHKWDLPYVSSGASMYHQIEQYYFDGANMFEFELAPVPFRVSWNGSACALLAGQRVVSTATAMAATNVMEHYAWVDWEVDATGFRLASTTARHSPTGTGRGYSFRRGPTSYRHWGTFNGPTPGLEVSHDGRSIAFTYVDVPAADNITSTNSQAWMPYDEHIIYSRATSGGANPWDTFQETLVTKGIFSDSPHFWKMGALCFSENDDGFFFWAGYNSSGDVQSISYQNTGQYTGSFYSFQNNNTAAGGIRREVFQRSEGGSDNTTSYNTFTGASQCNPSGGNWSGTQGYIRPVGGWVQKNNKFLYIVALCPVNSAQPYECVLVGINITTVLQNQGGAFNINGIASGRGFRVGNWPAQRGFMPTYGAADPGISQQYRYYIPGKWTLGTTRTMARDKGWVFFGSHYAPYGPSSFQYASTSFGGGPDIPAYYGDYNGYDGRIEGFNAEVGGPIARLSHPASTANNTAVNRGVSYIEVKDDGTQLLWEYNSLAYYYRYMNYENIGVIRNIGFNAVTGAINASFDPTNDSKLLEGSIGRAGESMCFDSSGTKAIYAFKAAASNENQMQVVEATYNATTNNWTFYRDTTTGRYSVLISGR